MEHNKKITINKIEYNLCTIKDLWYVGNFVSCYFLTNITNNIFSKEGELITVKKNKISSGT